MAAYYSIDDERRVHFDFTKAKLGLVPRANGVIVKCGICKKRGELRGGRVGKNGALRDAGGGAG